jgi:predicted 3-demethylubiquinone-9 3-methyltransferase (glyoxalase superfamily)
MPKLKQRIKTFLWFDRQAEEAANFYVSLFPDSRILSVSRYGSAMPDRKGTVMVCAFQLAGQEFLALNGSSGPQFNDSVSLLVECGTQAEVDELGAGSRRAAPRDPAAG